LRNFIFDFCYCIIALINREAGRPEECETFGRIGALRGNGADMEKINLASLGRMAVAGLLISQLTFGQVAPDGSGVKQRIAALTPKANVELQLTDGSDLRGRVVSHSEADFVLKESGPAGMKTIAYDQVRSVSQLKANHSKTKWIIIGVVAAVVVVGVVIGVQARCGPFGCGKKGIAI
jgi:hypothetical protein